MNDYVLDVKNLLPRYAELFCENISLSLTYIKRKNNPQFIVLWKRPFFIQQNLYLQKVCYKTIC